MSILKTIATDFYNSFFDGRVGMGAKRLSGFAGVITAIKLSFHFGSAENVENLTIIWLTFSSLCFGLVLVKDIIDFKNGKKDV